jgi:hypothetical protein
LPASEPTKSLSSRPDQPVVASGELQAVCTSGSAGEPGSAWSMTRTSTEPLRASLSTASTWRDSPGVIVTLAKTSRYTRPR